MFAFHPRAADRAPSHKAHGNFPSPVTLGPYTDLIAANFKFLQKNMGEFFAILIQLRNPNK